MSSGHKSVRSGQPDSAANRPVSTLAAQISHDLTTPLAGLMSIEPDMHRLDTQAQDIFREALQRLRLLARKYAEME